MISASSLRKAFPRGVKGLIFDCDGVLVDSRTANSGYYNLLLRELGKPPMTPDQEAYTHMASALDAVRHIMTPEELEQLPAITARFPYRETALPLLTLQPDVGELLRFLQGAGIRLAVHTNRGDSMWDVLDRFGLRGVFDPVMTVNTVPPKPAPDGTVRVLETWGIDPHEAGFVGDSTTDAGAARGAGVPFIAYRNPGLDAAVHTDSFAELRRALAEVLQNREGLCC